MWPTWAPRRARRRAPGSDGVQVPAGEGTSRDPAACRPGQQGFRGSEHPAKALSVPHGPRLGTRNHSPGPAPALGRGHLGQPHLAEGLSPPHTAWLWVQVGGGAGPGTRAGSTFVLQHRVRTCGRGGLTQGEGGGAGRGGGPTGVPREPCMLKSLCKIAGFPRCGNLEKRFHWQARERKFPSR